MRNHRHVGQAQLLPTACMRNLLRDNETNDSILLTIISFSATAQSLIGKDRAYYGHTLELRGDSTFRYEWKFDLASSWTTGQWKVSNRIVYSPLKSKKNSQK